MKKILILVMVIFVGLCGCNFDESIKAEKEDRNPVLDSLFEVKDSLEVEAIFLYLKIDEYSSLNSRELHKKSPEVKRVLVRLIEIKKRELILRRQIDSVNYGFNKYSNKI